MLAEIAARSEQPRTNSGLTTGARDIEAYNNGSASVETLPVIFANRVAFI
jgi:hypothetical protein